jgi:SAM-dependent methyltransferase
VPAILFLDPSRDHPAQPESMTMNAQIQPHNHKPASVWSSGGAAYDEISRQIASALAHCVRRLDPRPGEMILDVATGTGWTSRLAAERGAIVTGVDIAAELLAAARIKAPRDASLDYKVGDAEALPFGDGGFDGVTSTFGVMFASRPEAAAAELARVCRKGGRIALTTWKPDSTVFEMFKVMRAYMPPPPTPAPPSPFAWGSRERMTELFGDTFDLAFEEGDTVCYERDGEAVWNAFVNGYGPTRMLAEALEPAKREALHRDFVAFHDGFMGPLGVAMPRRYLLTVGTRR